MFSMISCIAFFLFFSFFKYLNGFILLHTDLFVLQCCFLSPFQRSIVPATRVIMDVVLKSEGGTLAAVVSE